MDGFDLPEAYCNAVRPGIAMYGLTPSRTVRNPRVQALKPVLEWKTRITCLKEVPVGTGLSYGHIVRVPRIAVGPTPSSAPHHLDNPSA